MIPGARGCTAQSCDLRDQHEKLVEQDISLFGISTQQHEEQRECSDRLNLPFLLLSDADYKFTNLLNLPTFTVNDRKLLKRHTLVIHKSLIEHVFYPIFPPNKHADEIINWLNQNVIG